MLNYSFILIIYLMMSCSNLSTKDPFLEPSIIKLPLESKDTSAIIKENQEKESNEISNINVLGVDHEVLYTTKVEQIPISPTDIYLQFLFNYGFDTSRSSLPYRTYKVAEPYIIFNSEVWKDAFGFTSGFKQSLYNQLDVSSPNTDSIHVPITLVHLNIGYRHEFRKNYPPIKMLFYLGYMGYFFNADTTPLVLYNHLSHGPKITVGFSFPLNHELTLGTNFTLAPYLFHYESPSASGTKNHSVYFSNDLKLTYELNQRFSTILGVRADLFRYEFTGPSDRADSSGNLIYNGIVDDIHTQIEAGFELRF